MLSQNWIASAAPATYSCHTRPSLAYFHTIQAPSTNHCITQKWICTTNDILIWENKNTTVPTAAAKGSSLNSQNHFHKKIAVKNWARIIVRLYAATCVPIIFVGNATNSAEGISMTTNARVYLYG